MQGAAKFAVISDAVNSTSFATRFTSAQADPGWEEISGIRAYALDGIPEYGTACLVYGLGGGPATPGQRRDRKQVGPPEKAQVWFKDRR